MEPTVYQKCTAQVSSNNKNEGLKSCETDSLKGLNRN